MGPAAPVSLRTVTGIFTVSLKDSTRGRVGSSTMGSRTRRPLVRGTEAAAVRRHRHDPQGSLEFRQLDLCLRPALPIGGEDAAPESHRFDPSDPFRAHVLGLPLRKIAAAGGRGSLHIRQEQAEAVEGAHPQSQPPVEMLEGIRALLGDELEDSLIHRRHGDGGTGGRIDAEGDLRLRPHFLGHLELRPQAVRGPVHG